MKISEHFDGRNLIHMMYGSENIDILKSLWGKDGDLERWSELLHACYWELSYVRAGGDNGYLANPPIAIERIKYLEELIAFLEGAGIQAINDAP